MSNAKNIFILSEKSSGSSACQNLLVRFSGIQHIAKTRHFENESLYWTKAASVLGKPQIKMVDSEVPIERTRARADLVALLTDNLDHYTPPVSDEELITDGWRQLCRKYSPIFLEKSPHHLCQWSALELIVDHIRKVDDVEFLVIGLIRNPMDTIYSQHKRFGSYPEPVERQWLTAYRNLLKLKKILGSQLIIVRYEDMVSSLEFMKPVFNFCEVTADGEDEDYLHQKSLQKWKADKWFGFTLSEETIQLSEEYGYQRDELANEVHPLWSVVGRLRRTIHLVGKPRRRAPDG